MSLFSKSKSKGFYPKQNHGGDYYKRPHGLGGLLGKIFDVIKGSQSRSHSHSKHDNGHYSNHRNDHYPNKYRRKSSWS